MQEHWKFNGPPVYMAVAGYLGMIKSKPRKSKSGKPGGSAMTGDWADLARSMQAAGGSVV